MCQGLSIDGKTHPSCKTRYSIDGCFSGLLYKGVVKKLLYQYKYQPYLSDLTGFLTDLLYESLIQNEVCMQVLGGCEPLFVPIPLSQKRMRKRGYNQSALLAKALVQKTGGSVVPLLKRTKETKPQYGLSREEREKNMKGAFKKNEKITMKNEKLYTIFLVDDVVTTGSTLVEAANILKRSGFTKVWAITLAQD